MKFAVCLYMVYILFKKRFAENLTYHFVLWNTEGEMYSLKRMQKHKKKCHLYY